MPRLRQSPPRPGGAQGGQGAAGGLGAIRADGRGRRRKDEAWAAGWREVTDLSRSVHTGVSVDALARLFLGRRFALKGSVDHKVVGQWPLGDAQRLYAAADACVVADLVVSIAEKEASRRRCCRIPRPRRRAPPVDREVGPAMRGRVLRLHPPARGGGAFCAPAPRERHRSGVQRHLQTSPRASRRPSAAPAAPPWRRCRPSRAGEIPVLLVERAPPEIFSSTRSSAHLYAPAEAYTAGGSSGSYFGW